MRRKLLVRVTMAVVGATMFAGTGTAMADGLNSNGNGLNSNANGKQTIEGTTCGIRIVQFGQTQDIITTDSVLTIRANGNRRLVCKAQLPVGQPVEKYSAKGTLCGTGDGTQTVKSKVSVDQNGKVKLVCRYKAPGNGDDPDEGDDT